MELKRRHPHRSSRFAFTSFFLVLVLVIQGHAEIERNRRSNQLTQTPSKRHGKSLSYDGSQHTRTLSDECTRHFENWMHNISTTMFPENATLVVDWSDLDDLLTAKNCTYEQLWIELWRVNENELPLIGSKDSDASKNEFGTPEWFAKYERCNELDETLFAYHSIRAHHRKPRGIEKKSTKNKNHFDEKADSMKAKHMAQIEPISLSQYGQTYSTKTTFLHVVENSYILRLCPCGKVIRNRRVCDCENTSALCSRVIKIDQPEKARVFESCRQPDKPKDNTERNTKSEDSNAVPRHAKNAITMKSPSTTCTSVLLAGSLTPCTPVQRYDRVKVELHPASIQQMECLWGVDWLQNEEPGSTTIVSVSDLKIADVNGTSGDFSVKIENLKENSTFCVVVELVDHPYCDSHLTIGHQLNQPIVCTNHVLQPIILPKCTEGPIIIDDTSSDSRRIIIGTLAGLMGLLAIIGIFIFYYRCKSKKRERTERGKLQSPTKHPYLNSTPIIKSGALVSNSQATSCTNTLLSKISVTIPDIFLLYFPDTKHFEEVNSIFRDWLASLGNRVYDLSDSKYDEEISKDPESWVMKILMKPNVRILVIDSPVARFSMALASSSTATTSLVSSTASVDSILETNDDETSNVEDANSKEMELEDEEEEVRIPLSQKQHHSTGNTLQCNASSLGNHPLPECALEDSRYELRVFAMKMIQSRFIGKYKQVIVLRYDNGLPHQNKRLTKTQPHHPPSSSIYTNKDVSSTTTATQSSHILDDGGTTTHSSMSSFHHQQQEIARKLTPHKQCLVLPQHMPELRSWLRGHGDLYCSERSGNDGLSDFIEMDNALSPAMTEELPSDEYPKMNGTNMLPHFHRYRLTSTSSSQAYTASTTSHPSSPLLSSALESKLRSSLSTSSSSSTASSSASNNPNKLYSSRKKSTSSATTTSIV